MCPSKSRTSDAEQETGGSIVNVASVGVSTDSVRAYPTRRANLPWWVMTKTSVSNTPTKTFAVTSFAQVATEVGVNISKPSPFGLGRVIHNRQRARRTIRRNRQSGTLLSQRHAFHQRHHPRCRRRLDVIKHIYNALRFRKSVFYVQKSSCANHNKCGRRLFCQNHFDQTVISYDCNRIDYRVFGLGTHLINHHSRIEQPHSV